MDLKAKKATLEEIYRQYGTESARFRESAVCGPGCSYCCTEMGAIDITTLEGVVIREHLAALAKPLRKKIVKKIEQNRTRKERGRNSACPFLLKNRTCGIYGIRPFSCRQLYSLKRCQDAGPTVHKDAVELAKETVANLQRLDETGYSGHLSYILHLLEDRDFRKLYLSGGFDPTGIMAYGKSHGIFINRSVC